MSLSASPQHHRFRVLIISQAVWLYHRFNNSYCDVQEPMAFWGIILSHETIRTWCLKFSHHFTETLKERERKLTGKWLLDKMTLRLNGEMFILWRAVDSEGHELDVFFQKRRNKKSEHRQACLKNPCI